MSTGKINEVGYSHLLSDILNLSSKEDDYSIYKSFLKMLDKVAGNNPNIFSNLDVKSPVIKAEDDHVDVSIKDSSYRIIIENKINGASDQQFQLARYIDGSINGAHYLEKDVYVVYITDTKESPSRQTWIRRENEKLIATDFKDDFERRYVNITKANIGDWLENDVLILCDNNQEKKEQAANALKSFQNGNIKDFNSEWVNDTNERLHKIIFNWKEYTEFLYKRDDTINVTTSDSTIDVKFKWPSRQYEFGCRLEIYPERSILRYGISKSNNIEYFTKDNLTKLFNLFFKIDRHCDRYQSFNILENPEYWAYKTVKLYWRSDYEYNFALNYYLLDLIDKIIMFIIAPSKVGLLSPIENSSRNHSDF